MTAMCRTILSSEVILTLHGEHSRNSSQITEQHYSGEALCVHLLDSPSCALCSCWSGGPTMWQRDSFQRRKPRIGWKPAWLSQIPPALPPNPFRLPRKRQHSSHTPLSRHLSLPHCYRPCHHVLPEHVSSLNRRILMIRGPRSTTYDLGGLIPAGASPRMADLLCLLFPLKLCLFH